MSLLVVGSVAYDSVKTPFGEVDEVLGGSASYFGLSASFFTEVSLVACVGQDFRSRDVELFKKHRIDLGGLEYMEGRTFRWKGSYGYDLNDARTLDTQLNVFARFVPTLPDHYQDSEFIFLGNIDPALQRQVLKQVRRPRLVACDTMNYWIERTPESLRETLKRVDVLLINDAETRQLTGEANLVKAAQIILSWGPRVLVVKRGEYGVLMFSLDERGNLLFFGVPAYPLESVFDPTGAGDSFAGGFMGYLAATLRDDEQAMRQAIIFGSVMASFNVEKFSVERLQELNLEEIHQRFKEFRRITHFDDVEQPVGSR